MSRHQEHLGSFLPVLEAYRADIQHRAPDDPLSDDDGAWITIGTLLTRVSTIPLTDREHLWAEVRKGIHKVLGATRWKSGPLLDAAPPANDEELGPRVRLLCEQIEDTGAVHLADAILMAYVQSGATLSELERGRMDALRGRFAWKRGDHDTAVEHYERVNRLARRIHSAELEVRAAVGHAIVSRLRGNYPASRKAALRAVRIAEANNLGRLAALGHQSLMIAAVVADDFNTALQHSWLAYTAVQGDEVAEAGRLADIAQLFLDAGHVDIARAGFAAIWRRPMPERVRLPVLGGAALAAARQGDVNAVLNLATIVDVSVDDRTLPYASATLRLDIAEALYHVGHTEAAERLLAEAAAASERRQYHELTHRAHALRRTRSAPPAMQELSTETLEIGDALRSLATVGA